MKKEKAEILVEENVEQHLSGYAIPLPQKIVEHYKIENDEMVGLTIEESSMRIHFKDREEDRRIIPFVSYLLPATITTVTFIVFFAIQKQNLISLIGDISIATFVMSLGLISGILNFSYFFFKSKKGSLKINTQLISFRTFPTIVISFSIILFFILLVIFRFIGFLFEGVQFDLWTSAFINFLFVSLINYIMVSLAYNITTKIILNSLILTIVGGVLIAMATNSDLQWWQYNFSFLGTPEAKNAWNFNITLMFSALLMIALIDFLFTSLELKIKRTKRLMALRILLILTAISLGGVGLFPYNDNPVFQTLHNRTAGNLVYLIIILIVSIRWLLPNPRKDFLNTSYIIGAVLIVTNILFEIVGYLSLTAFELIAFILAFSWVFLLFQEIEHLISDTDTNFEIPITITKKNIEIPSK